MPMPFRFRLSSRLGPLRFNYRFAYFRLSQGGLSSISVAGRGAGEQIDGAVGEHHIAFGLQSLAQFSDAGEHAVAKAGAKSSGSACLLIRSIKVVIVGLAVGSPVQRVAIISISASSLTTMAMRCRATASTSSSGPVARDPLACSGRAGGAQHLEAHQFGPMGLGIHYSGGDERLEGGWAAAAREVDPEAGVEQQGHEPCCWPLCSITSPRLSPYLS